MGHAGAFTLPGESSALTKVEALRAAGVTIVNHPLRFGPVLKTLLSNSSPGRAGVTASGAYTQQRGIHTNSRRVTLIPEISQGTVSVQRRTIYLTGNTAFNFLRQRGIMVREQSHPGKQRLLAVSVNRSSRNPCVIAASGSDAGSLKTFDFNYNTEGQDLPISDITRHLGLSDDSVNSLHELINKLVSLFMEKEAFLLETQIIGNQGNVEVTAAHLGFDDAAFRSCKRQGDIQELRDFRSEEPTEVDAEKDGIVYIKLDGNIGTLVNGAGLAMNTIDALADAGGRAANFLDTGGKATSATVKKSVSTKNKLISYLSRPVMEPSTRYEEELNANLFLLNSSRLS